MKKKIPIMLALLLFSCNLTSINATRFKFSQVYNSTLTYLATSSEDISEMCKIRSCILYANSDFLSRKYDLIRRYAKPLTGRLQRMEWIAVRRQLVSDLHEYLPNGLTFRERFYLTHSKNLSEYMANMDVIAEVYDIISMR